MKILDDGIQEMTVATVFFCFLTIHQIVACAAVETG